MAQQSCLPLAGSNGAPGIGLLDCDREVPGEMPGCDGMEAIKALSEVSFSRVSRELNKVAYELAHLAIRSKESRVSLVDIADCIKSLVYFERPA
jgi:hypothetical protein